MSSPYLKILSSFLSTFHKTCASGMKTFQFGSNLPFRSYLLLFAYTHHRVQELTSNPLPLRQLDPPLPWVCHADSATHTSGSHEEDTSVTVPFQIPVEKYLTFLPFQKTWFITIHEALSHNTAICHESAPDSLSSGYSIIRDLVAWDIRASCSGTRPWRSTNKTVFFVGSTVCLKKKTTKNKKTL